MSPGNVTKTGITVYNAPSPATLINSGTVTGGIAIDSSTITGQISDTGTLSGGIFIDSASKIAANGGDRGRTITGPTFTGGITNYGTITSASGNGIVVGGKVNRIATLDQVIRRRHHNAGTAPCRRRQRHLSAAPHCRRQRHGVDLHRRHQPTARFGAGAARQFRGRQPASRF